MGSNNELETQLSLSSQKKVLLKAVNQVIPTYTMSLFALPKKRCKEIASYMSKFWWSSMNKNLGIHWRSWKKLSESKSQEGLGFRDLEAFNQALLATQVGRLIQNLNSLVG